MSGGEQIPRSKRKLAGKSSQSKKKTKSDFCMDREAKHCRLRQQITDALLDIVRSSLTYQTSFELEGLVAITLDSSDICLVNLSSCVESGTTKSQVKEAHQHAAHQGSGNLCPPAAEKQRSPQDYSTDCLDSNQGRLDFVPTSPTLCQRWATEDCTLRNYSDNQCGDNLQIYSKPRTATSPHGVILTSVNSDVLSGTVASHANDGHQELPTEMAAEPYSDGPAASDADIGTVVVIKLEPDDEGFYYGEYTPREHQSNSDSSSGPVARAEGVAETNGSGSGSSEATHVPVDCLRSPQIKQWNVVMKTENESTGEAGSGHPSSVAMDTYSETDRTSLNQITRPNSKPKPAANNSGGTDVKYQTCGARERARRYREQLRSDPVRNELHKQKERERKRLARTRPLTAEQRERMRELSRKRQREYRMKIRTKEMSHRKKDN